MATPNQIRKNNVIKYNGEVCLVVECAVKTPPNLRAHAQMVLRNLFTGKMIHVRCNTGENFDLLENDTKELEYLYENMGHYNFMDHDTFETYELSREAIEDAIAFLVPSQRYNMMFVEERPIAVVLPTSVAMKIVDSPEGVRGDSASNVQKPATTETGLTINVPLFIKAGDVVKVSTEDKTYLGRA